MLHIKELPPSASTVTGAVLSVALVLAGWLVPGEARAQTLTTLWSFTGGPDGAIPNKGPVRDSAGNLYGVTNYGANVCAASPLGLLHAGCGTLWKLDAKGILTTLVTFTGENGALPDGNLTLEGDVLYGTTFEGGRYLQGTLFSVTTAGKDFKILHDFKGTDGANPDSAPRVDSEGNLYSITLLGGPDFGVNGGYGVLFERTKSGEFIQLHNFTGGEDGAQPGRISINDKGIIFGTTGYSIPDGKPCYASGQQPAGCGTVYSFDPKTRAFEVLYTFGGFAGGTTPTAPYAPVIGGFDSAGNLYGAAQNGGDNAGAVGYGELFEMKLTEGVYGTPTALHIFTGGDDGAYPLTPAVLDTGEIIGTTQAGPIPVNEPDAGQGVGVLYRFDEKSEPTFSTLYTFSYATEIHGIVPIGTPVVTSSGLIYGTTAYGGNGEVYPCNDTQDNGGFIYQLGCGTVYEFNPKGKEASPTEP